MERPYDVPPFIHERTTTPEIDGCPIKVVSSNIRPPLDWSSVHIQPEGIGKEGDLLVVRALTNGARNEVENPNGRDDKLYPGDHFIGVLANRHSGTSESGDVPSEGIDLTLQQPLQLLAAGGIVGIASGSPASMRGDLMQLQPVGLLEQKGELLNLEKLCGPGDELLKPSAPIVLVMGTSAEVGKTTSSAAITRSLKADNIHVGATKFSGTGRMRDIRSLANAGAMPWLDFPDVGLATTYTSPEKFTPAIYKLFNLINSGNPDIIMAEAGGDPIEANVSTFLANQNLMKYVRAAIVVAGDVMGMMGTIDYLHKFTPDLDILLAQPKGRNPVTTRERVNSLLPGLRLFDSMNPNEVAATAKFLQGKL